MYMKTGRFSGYRGDRRKIVGPLKSTLIFNFTRVEFAPSDR